MAVRAPLRRREWVVTADGYSISFWGDQNTLELDRVMWLYNL